MSSNVVENRIVEMQFDNRDFVNNVNATIPVLDSLSNKLKMLGNVPGTALHGINGLAVTFRSLPKEVLATTAQVEILHRAIETVFGVVENLKKEFYSITFDQIGAGFDKYGQKTQSVQTIMAATGKSVEEVEEQLERLTWFSDETSYSFTDMVSNVGKFTSQGIGLETAVTQMQGIATWAAKSGQNAQAASRAMYNISQAMGTGAMMTKDWMSIENANMATAEFKQLAIDTAESLGKLKKGQVTIETFRDSLSKKWFDTDVMSEVFKQYGGYADDIYNMSDDFKNAAQAMEAYNAANKDAVGSLGQTAFLAAQEAKTFEDVIDATKDAVSTNWMNVWQNVFGNYEEARVLWTDLANKLWDVFAGPIDKMNELMTKWHDLRGRDDLIRSFNYMWNAIFGYEVSKNVDGEEKIFQYAGILEKLKQALFKIIPGLEEFDGLSLRKITQSIKLFTSHLTTMMQHFEIKNSLIDKFATIFQGVMAVFRLGVKIVRSFLDILVQLGPTFGTIGDFLLDVIVKISEFFIWLDKSADEIGLWKTIADSVVSILSKLGEAFVIVFTAIKDSLEKIFPKDNGLTKIGEAAEEAKDPIEKLGEIIETIAYGISDSIAFMTPIIINAIEWVKTAFNKLKTDFSSFGTLISELWSNITSTFTAKDGIQSVGSKSSIDDFIDNLVEKFEKLKGIISTVISVGAGGGLLGWLFSLVIAINKFDWGIGNVTEALSNFGGIKDTLKGFTSAFKNLGTAFSENGIFGKKVSGSLSKSLDSLAKTVAANNFKTIAVSLLMLAGALFLLALLPYGKLLLGSAVIAGLGEALYGFLYQLNKEVKGMNKSDIPALLAAGAVLLTMAAAIGLIALALTQVSLVGNKIWGAMAVISGAFIALGIGVSLLIEKTKGAKPTEMLGMAAVIVAMSAGLLLISKAIKTLGRIETDKLIAAGLALGGIMTAMTTMAIVMSEFGSGNGNDMLKAAGALVLVAAGVAILAGAIGFLTLLNFDKMQQAALVIAGILTIFALIVAACGIWGAQMGTATTVLVALGASLLLISASFFIFADALAKIATVLGVLATIFTIFSAFDESLGQKFSDFIDMLIEKIPAVITAIIKGIGEAPLDLLFGIINKIFEFIMQSIENWMPRVFQAFLNSGRNLGKILGELINELVKGIDKAKNKLYEKVGKILDFLTEMFDKQKEKVGNLVKKVLEKVFAVFKELVPNILDALQPLGEGLLELGTTLLPSLFTFLEGFLGASLDLLLNLLYAYLPKINQFIVDSINWLNASLLDLIPQITEDALTLLYRLIESLLNKLPDLLVQSITVIGVILKTLLKMIVETVIQLITTSIETGLYLMERIVEIIDEYKDPMIQAMADFINALAEVLETDMDPVLDAMDRLISAVIDVVIKVVQRNDQKIITAGKNIIKGLINGIVAQSGELFAKATQVGTKILSKIKESLKEHSPSKATTEMGKFLMEGLSLGMKSGMSETLATADKSGGTILDTLKDSFSGVSDYINSNIDMNPTITPVLDLSDVRNNIGSLSSMFGTQQVNAIATGGGFASASLMGTDINAMSNMMQKLNDKLDDLHVTTSATPVEVNVNLEGDTNKLFKAMVDKNNNRIRATGFNQFTRQKG